jgi:hypothetical protein
MARTRSRDILSAKGDKKTLYNSDGSVYIVYDHGHLTVRRETCVDTLSVTRPYVQPHDLAISKWKVEPFVADGWTREGFRNVEYVGYDMLALRRPEDISALRITPWAYYFTQATASMNPDVPVVDLPLFLFEFKDFPSMLKNMGDVMLTGVNFSKKSHNIGDVIGGVKLTAESFLAYKFGWAPLLADLKTMTGIALSIDQRFRQLRNMQNRKKVRRQLTTSSVSYDGGGVFASSPYFGVLETDVTETVKAWFTARPYMMDVLPPLIPDEHRDVLWAYGLADGLTPSTVWNAIPWSWLVDYFINVGDFLDATRGYTRWQMGDVCVMEEFTRVRSRRDHLAYTAGLKLSGGRISFTTKRRQVRHNPSPNIAFDPVLTGSQMSNLGALATSLALGGKTYKS